MLSVFYLLAKFDVNISLNLTELFKGYSLIFLFIGIPFIVVVIGVVIYFVFLFLIKTLNFYKMNLTIGKNFALKPSEISVKEEARRNMMVYAELAKLAQVINCHLISVFQLHNGGSYTNGKSMLKFSQTHYYVERGHLNFYNRYKFQDRLLSLAQDWLGGVLEHGQDFNSVENLPLESEWRREFELLKFGYYAQVLVKSGGVDEMIVTAFFKREVDELEKDVILKFLQKQSLVIAALLNDALTDTKV